MNIKNLLLGHGETLTYDITIPSGGSPKKHPYSINEARLHFLNDIKNIVRDTQSIPDLAKPNGKIVANFLLHPTYIAKSYYPEYLFRELDFINLGSKSTTISPRKTTLKGPPKNFQTSNIFISGKEDTFKNLIEHLSNDNIDSKLLEDIRKNENINLFSPYEKIKSSLNNDDDAKKYEVVLHTPSVEKNILDMFYEYAQQLDININIDKRIETEGLTFFPIFSNNEKIHQLANFTYLRVLREMPKLRMYEPIITRSVYKMDSKISLPKEPAIANDINVAIFDGGIGNTDLSSWCKETIFPNGEKTAQDCLNHGSDVTSTVLFGNIKHGQTTLPRPYTNIDHYRVIDNNINTSDPDLFEVLNRILSVLEEKNYDYVNLSLGPRMPIDDDDVHVWTSSLDNCLYDKGTLLTVAVGNDGSIDEMNRIQPPSDLVNALAVGAATTQDQMWEKTNYSCVGPGRSPGLIKPDGITFGGTSDNPFLVYSPITQQINSTAGTSFSSPLTLRTCLGLASSLNKEISPLTIKALMIHNTEKKDLPQSEIGWGRFPQNANEILECQDNEASIIYQGDLNASQHLRIPIPFPDKKLDGKVSIKATFCFTAEVNPAHPDNYTNNGLEIIFRPKGVDTKTFFSLNSLYETELEARTNNHKWETTLHKNKDFLASSLKDPCFDVVYRARDAGKNVKPLDANPLPYVLIVTVQSSRSNELYNLIRQKYDVLQPVKLRQEVQIRT